MVKFGRHLQFFLECEDESETSYIVPYNKLRDEIFANQHKTFVDPSYSFEQEWRSALEHASKDYQESMSSCMNSLFEAIANIPNVRGASFEAALKIYTSTVGAKACRDLLIFLKNIQSAASLNSEGLRKLVKKYDKQQESSLNTLSTTLLPQLYMTNFFAGAKALNEAIETLRDQLDDLDEEYEDDYEAYSDDEKNYREEKKQSEDYEEILIGRRANEMLWFRDTVRQIPQEDIKHAVAHRGFHNPTGRSDLRPLENSLAAFEAAWSNGMQICECDVSLTKDEKLVMCHDSNFARLSLDPSSDTSNTTVSDLTFKELIALTLKNGVRAPLLSDVLNSASMIGPDKKLIVEIKPGNNQAAMALARLLTKNPEYCNHIDSIMSFDLWSMHSLKQVLKQNLEHLQSTSPVRLSSSVDSQMFRKASSAKDSLLDTANAITLPKILLLTVADPPKDNYELWVDCSDYSPVDGWVNTDESCLDGVYVKFESEMLEADGRAELHALCSKYTVGIWGVVNKDPDDYKTMRYLVNECGVSYFNTDMPHDFLK